MFSLENTTGYTQAECDALNAEFEIRWEIGEFSQWGRDEAEKIFADEVARR